MTLRLAKGQNAALLVPRVTVTITGAPPLELAALLVDDAGRARSSAHLVHRAQPGASGVSWAPAALDVDTVAVPAGVAAVVCLASTDAGGPGFGGAPTAVVRDGAGTPLAEFVLTGLSTERAVIAVEVYRRGPGWKVRAVGQGYDGGLAQAAREHGVEVAAVAPVLEPPTLDPEQVSRRVHAVWEDAARSTAAWLSARAYAEQRRDAEVSTALADPAQRATAAGAQARQLALDRHDELVARADAEHERDIAQLTAELAVLEAAFPAPVSGWDSDPWTTWSPAQRLAPAVRLGTVHTDAATGLRLPLLAGLPLRAPLWVDGTGGSPGTVVDAVRALVLRLLAAHPAGALRLEVVDLVGGLGDALGVVAGTLTDVLTRTLARVDLVQMAQQAGLGAGPLPDGGARLVVVHGLPHGLDEPALLRLQSLVQAGPGAGVHLLVTGEAEHLLGRDSDRLLALVAERFQRLPVTFDGTLRDPWVDHEWAFTPDLGPRDPATATALLRRAAGAG